MFKANGLLNVLYFAAGIALNFTGLYLLNKPKLHWFWQALLHIVFCAPGVLLILRSFGVI